MTESHDDQVTISPTLTKVSRRHRKFHRGTQWNLKAILNVIYNKKIHICFLIPLISNLHLSPIVITVFYYINITTNIYLLINIKLISNVSIFYFFNGNFHISFYLTAGTRAQRVGEYTS